jgi:hypothetical protein
MDEKKSPREMMQPEERAVPAISHDLEDRSAIHLPLRRRQKKRSRKMVRPSTTARTTGEERLWLTYRLTVSPSK